jgi:hypothetical protein
MLKSACVELFANPRMAARTAYVCERGQVGTFGFRPSSRSTSTPGQNPPPAARESKDSWSRRSPSTGRSRSRSSSGFPANRKAHSGYGIHRRPGRGIAHGVRFARRHHRHRHRARNGARPGIRRAGSTAGTVAAAATTTTAVLAAAATTAIVPAMADDAAVQTDARACRPGAQTIFDAIPLGAAPPTATPYEQHRPDCRSGHHENDTQRHDRGDRVCMCAAARAS